MSDKKQEITIPPRLYYPLPEAAKRLNCSIRDVIHMAATNVIKLSIYIPSWMEKEDEKFCVIYEGMHVDADMSRNGSYVSLSGEGWDITGIYDYVPKENEMIKFSQKYAKFFTGFYYLGSRTLVDFEFNNEAESISVSFLSTHGEEDIVRDVILSSMKGVLFPTKYLCVMADEINSINLEKSGVMPQFSDDSGNNHNPNKQAKMIKALIEIHYGHGSSKNMYSLMKEGSKNTQPGHLAEDFTERNIKLPAGHKTVQGWVDSVELDALEISKDGM